jgi:hypothetical protein
MDTNQKVTQAIVTSQADFQPHQKVERFALFDADGTPFIFPETGEDVTYSLITTGSAIGTVGKTTTADEPVDNTLVAIKFTNGNNALSPTIAFNGGTARAIHIGGDVPLAGEFNVAANGVALFFFDGTVLHLTGVYSSIAESQTGANIVLTGYVPVTGNILATDTLNEAIAKFEARIEALETP